MEATVVVPTAMNPTEVHVKFAEEGKLMKARARVATADEHEVQNAVHIADVCFAARTQLRASACAAGGRSKCTTR